jgi:type II secretory pathway predicted ATPase ExeA
MVPYFNTSGPCVAGEHHMLPPERRLTRAMELVEQGRYFVLRSGRQTGKTTCAQWLVDHYNAAERFAAVWLDLQTAREQPDRALAFRTVLNELDRSLARDLQALAVESPDREDLLKDPATALLRQLSALSRQLPRPLVLFFDESDGLVGEAMVSFLTQLRAGYIDRRKVPFPHSVVLIGMREVRDYALSAEERRTVSWLGTTSPFNITAETQTLAPFSAGEVGELLGQHTAATGQPFEAEAVTRVHALSQGHPWLVNALADQVVRDVQDRSVVLTADHVAAGKETLILERRTHIDSLVARLGEERVRRVVAPMLVGEQTGGDVLDDDLAYVAGLGLIALRGGRYEVANPIYREVIPRALTHVRQTQIPDDPAWYIDADGRLNVAKLLRGFQVFWREDGHLAAEAFHYREAGPHLMLMAFLQRVVNSGGRVEREYGLGRGRLDLIIEWRGERHVVEVKLRRRTTTEARAVEQLATYLDGLGLSEGYLVLFDLRTGPSWEERIYEKALEVDDKRVLLLGC